MSNSTRSLAAAYGLAVLASILALLLTLLIDDPLVEPNTLLLFLAAVMCSSWYGGIGPGLVASVLTGLAAVYFYTEPAFTFALHEQSTVRLMEFTAVCVLISILNEARRRSQARAEAASAEAAAANRVKNQLLATISHELRTPLGAILGWVKVLRTQDIDPGVADRAVESIERSAKAEARLVEDLLDVSRTLTGRMQLHRQPIDLQPVLDAAIDTVRPALDAKAIALHTDFHCTRPVLGDPDRLQQVVWNLLSNAARFTPRNGSVAVAVEQVGEQARIMISDTGTGIDAADLPHIFELFHQGESSRSHGGLGLGLAIARHLAELHGGTLFAESGGRDRGARFIFELPTLSANGQPMAAFASAQA
jgi:signal transduction histidine kinase